MPLSSLSTPNCLEASLAQETDYADTHPSLTDRAEALGAEPRLPEASGKTAVALLPDQGAAYIEAFSAGWLEAAGENWREKHADLARQKAWFADLEAAAEEGPLEPDEALARAFLAEEFLGAEAALESFELALAASEDSDRALYV